MSGKSHWLGYWTRELPKQDKRFPTGWEEIREDQKTLVLLLSLCPDLSTKQTLSLQYLSPNPWKGWCYQEGSLGAPTPTPELQPVLFPLPFLAHRAPRNI